MASTADTRTPSLLLADAGKGFDCENAGLQTQQAAGKSEMKQRKKFAALVFTAMVFGLAGGTIGNYLSAPAIVKHGMGHGHGLGKAMAKALVTDIQHTVDDMNDAELGATFANLENDMCDSSVMPTVMQMLRDPKTKAQLDAMIADPRFPEEVQQIAEQSLAKGTLNPLKALGKFSAPGLFPTARSNAQRGVAPVRMEEKSGKAVAVGAAAVGGLVGIQLFGELPPAIALCLLAAYGTTQSNSFGDATKSVGTFASKVWDKTTEINEQYDVLPKAKSAADTVANVAANLNENYGITDKIDQKLLISEKVEKVTSKLTDVKDSVVDKVDDLKAKAAEPPSTD